MPAGLDRVCPLIRESSIIEEIPRISGKHKPAVGVQGEAWTTLGLGTAHQQTENRSALMGSVSNVTDGKSLRWGWMSQCSGQEAFDGDDSDEGLRWRPGDWGVERQGVKKQV
jgi:hypothetical protein